MLEDPVERRDGGSGTGECRLPSQLIPNNPRGINESQQQSGFPLSAPESTSTPAKMTSATSINEDAADVDRIATVFDDLNGYLSDTATTSLDYKIQTQRRKRKKKEEKSASMEREGEDAKCTELRDALPSPCPTFAVVPTPAPRGDSLQRVKELLTATHGISAAPSGEERCFSSLSRCGGGRATDLETIPETGEPSGGTAAKPGYFSLPRPASAMARTLRNTPQQAPPQPLIRSSSFVQGRGTQLQE